MIDQRSVTGPVPDPSQDDRSMQLFELLVSSLALLAAVLLALVR